jgi:toxin ParE1/3/4
VKVRWTRLALADLDSVYEYIAPDDPSVALRVMERIERAVSVLSRHPEAGRAGRTGGTRELVVSGTPFIVPYRFRRDAIQVLAVIHASRKWPTSLQ